MSSALRPDAVMFGGEISQAERAARVDLAAAYRLVAFNGWDDLVYTHLPAIVLGEADHFLINVFGLAFDEITASNLVEINGRGQLVGDWPEGIACSSVNVTGFALHAAMHTVRPDARCVIHLHNTVGIAASAQKHGLLLPSQHTLRSHRRIAYHGYEGSVFTPGEGIRLIASLGNHLTMLLRDHGMLTIGRIMAETHVLMATPIKVCEIQIQIWIQAQAGGEVVSPAPHVADRAAGQLEDGGATEGMIEWPALSRKLDKIDASYRDRCD